MIGSDAVIGWITTSTGLTTLGTYSLQAKDVADIDPNPSFVITNAQVCQVAGYTTILFTRAFKTGKNPIAPTGGYVIGSYSSNSYLVQHDVHSTIMQNVNFVTGSVVDSAITVPPLKIVHGVLQFIAFGLLFPFGILFARFAKTVGGKGLWFEVHRGVQITGWILAATAFTIAFFMVAGAHFNQPFHGQLGIAVMVAVTGQGLFGLLRPHKDESADKQRLARRLFEIAHPIWGYVLYFAFLVQIYAGIWAISTGNVYWMIGFSIVPVVYISLWIFLEVRRRRRSSGPSNP